MLYRHRIKRSFHANAAQYDGLATVQRRVTSRLAELLQAQHVAPDALLDVGCGTGTLLSLLESLYPGARHVGIYLAFNMTRHAAAKLRIDTSLTNGDAEQLPFADGVFDLVVSSSTLQWLESLNKSVSEMFRVAAPGGMVVIAYFGQETLWELRDCYRQVLLQRGMGGDERHLQRLHRFSDADHLREALSSLGAETLMVCCEREVVRHKDVRDLLGAIKNIGAGAGARRGVGGLGWRGILADLDAEYNRRFRVDDSIPATYEVVYAVARRTA